MTTLAPRIYVTDADAKVRAIANVAAHPRSPSRGDLCISFDGKTFQTVLFNAYETGPNRYNGKIVQPALEINGTSISFANGAITYDGEIYVLDENATISEIITKPVMRIVEIVETCSGYYISTQNLLTGRSHDYLDGKPLEIISGIRARGDDDDIVADSQYVGHRYLVRGDHMDTTNQTVTFDDQPATQLTVQDYEVVFADDLSSATVTKK